MPNGRVMRIDAERGCVYVARRGRSVKAPLTEVESAARVPGARVQYKLRRSSGIETAESVRLRRGTRTNKRQRRFGDLTGARRPGAKLKTSAQRTYGIDVTTQPFRVVTAWLSALEDQDLDAATSLYLPGAVVHLDSGQVTGRPRIRALVEESPWLGIDAEAADLRGVDRYVRAEATLDGDGDGEELVAYFVVVDGHITEQWLGPEPTFDAETGATDTEVVADDDVETSMVDYAREKADVLLAAVGSGGSRPQFKLSYTRNPNRQRMARSEVKLDVDGSVVRAHDAAPTMTEAIDLAIDRLRNNLAHLQDRERHKPTGLEPSEGTWRHGNLPTTRPPYFERPPAEREVVRHKSFAPDEVTVEEAAWDMALLDYDFYLFVELTTGLDALLELTQDGEHVLHRPSEPDGDKIPLPAGVELSAVVPPVLPPSEAVRFLDDSGQHLLFFENSVSQRGNALYRRYDGHYGLITPPTDDTEE